MSDCYTGYEENHRNRKVRDKARETGILEGLRMAAKAMCEHCAAGRPALVEPDYQNPKLRSHHWSDALSGKNAGWCRAGEIHDLITEREKANENDGQANQYR